MNGRKKWETNMKQLKQRSYMIWKWCLAILLVFSLIPTTVFAKEETLVLDLTQGNIVIKQDGYQIDGGSLQSYAGAYTIIGNAVSTDHTITVESTDAEITLDQVVINSDGRSPLTIKNGAHATIHLSNVNRFGTGWDGVHATNIVVGDQASLIIDGDGALTCNESLFYHKLSIGKDSSVSLNGGTIDLRASYVSVVDGAGTLIVNGADVRLRSDPYNGSSTVPIFSNSSVMIQSGTVEIYEKNVTFGNSDLSITGGTLYSSLSGFQLDADSLTLEGGMIQLDGTISDGLKADSDQWNGLVFEGKEGKVYGSYTLEQDLNVPSGKNIEVSKDSTLIIAEDATLRLNGNVLNEGTIINNGTIYLGLSSTYEGSKPENHPLKYEGNFSYIDEQGQTKQCQDPMVLFGEDTIIDSGWYLLKGEQVIDHRLVIDGDVHLILQDGSNINVQGGIEASQGNQLSIYAQSMGNAMGALQVIDVAPYDAGIGGSFGQSGGTMTFCGGKIYVSETSYGAAGIGGGYRGKSGGEITITGGTIEAQSQDWAAGIGGGDEGNSGVITITGGTITAIGSGDSGAGIGAGNNGTVDTITISGGTIHASAVHGAGIGGSYQQGAGTIIISGGAIDAFSEAGAGIGSGNEGSGGQVLISGGWIQADSVYGAGIGDGSDALQALTQFTTSEDGDAVIFASSISDQSQKEQWHGILFEGQNGQVYGGQLTSSTSFTIPKDYLLEVKEGTTWEVPASVQIHNEGMIHVDLGAQYTGAQPSGNPLYYEIAWDTDGDGSIDDREYIAYGKTPSHADGEKASTTENVYEFIGWSPVIGAVQQSVLYTANFAQQDRYYVIEHSQGDGYTLHSEDAAKLRYGEDYHFELELWPGYSKLDSYAVYVNGKELQSQADGSYVFSVEADTTITVTGIADVSAPLITGIEDGMSYYTTQHVMIQEENIQEVTVNGVPQSADFLLAGNQEITYTIVAKDMAGNTTTCLVTMKPLASLKAQVGEITKENVTSADQSNIESYIEQLTNLAAGTFNTSSENAEIQQMIEEAQTLLAQIEAAKQAMNSEAIIKVQTLNAENVVLQDQTDLLAAKEAIIAALETYGSNYTAEETKTLEERLQQAVELLAQIEKVQTIEDAIQQLPSSVQPDDLDRVEQIEQIKETIDVWSAHEKEMLSAQSLQKIEQLYQSLGDYQIIQGADATWQKGSTLNLTITANGALQRLQAIWVDGQLLSETAYQIESGSTILTLQASYLQTLDPGTHTLTFVYDHGSVETTFTILEEPNDPVIDTGTQNQSTAWIAVFVVACLAVGGILILRKRKK